MSDLAYSLLSRISKCRFQDTIPSFRAGINQESEIEVDSPKQQLDLQVPASQIVDVSQRQTMLDTWRVQLPRSIFILKPMVDSPILDSQKVDDGFTQPLVSGLAFDNCISDTQLFDPGGTNCVNDCGGLWYKQAYWCHGVGRTLKIGKKISPWLRDRACIRMRLMDPSLITHRERILKLAQRSHGMVLQEVMSLIFCLRAENISLEAELKRKLWCCGFYINEVIAENIDSEEMQGLKAMFANIDTDNSGTITYEELKAGLNKLGSKLTEGEVKQFLVAGDVDGNGSMDYIEVIIATMHRHMLESDENLDKAFLHFDKVGEWVHNWDRRMKLFAFEHEKRKEQDKKDLQDELAHVEFLFRIPNPECTDHASHVWQLWCHNTLVLDRLQNLMMILFAAREIDVTKRFGEALASVAKFSQSRSVATVLSSPASVHDESRLSSTAAIASGIVLGLFEDSRYKSESKKPSLTYVDIAGFGTGPGCSIELMKFDMSSSAAVFGAVKSIVGFYEVLQQNEAVLKFGFLHQHVFMYSPRTHRVWDPGGILLK